MACIIEEVNLGKTGTGEEKPSTAREAKNGVALDTGCTSSVAGQTWLRRHVRESTKKVEGEVKGRIKFSSMETTAY